MTIAVREIPGGVAVGLLPFPGLPHPNLEIVVEVSRLGADLLRVWFTLRGDVEVIAFPEAVPSMRADGLWEHTCVEAFITGGERGYQEFNLSPSGAWAAYRLEGYRDGMVEAEVDPVTVNVARMGNIVSIGADLRSQDFSAGDWRLGLSAIIEETSGAKSYWALTHPPEGPPDFHHPDCFALTLPAPTSAQSSPRT